MRFSGSHLFLSALSFSQVVHGLPSPQASLFPVGFEGDNLSAEFVTTISGNTIWLLEGTTAGVPITVTLLEDATEVFETAAIPTASETIAAICLFSKVGAEADCNEIVDRPGTLLTITTTGVASLIAIPTITGAATLTGVQSTVTAVSSTGTPSATFSSGGSSPSSSGGVSTLPAQLPTSSTPQSTVPSSTAVASTTASTSTSAGNASGASALHVEMVWSMIVPLVLAASMF